MRPHPRGGISGARKFLALSVIGVAGACAQNPAVTAPSIPAASATTPQNALQMTEPRVGHSATLLKDGRVLICGGEGTTTKDGWLDTAEIYSPGAGFTPTGRMSHAHVEHKALVLPDGRVLIVGGAASWGGRLKTTRYLDAEIYDPSSGTFRDSEATTGTNRLRGLDTAGFWFW